MILNKDDCAMSESSSKTISRHKNAHIHKFQLIEWINGMKCSHIHTFIYRIYFLNVYENGNESARLDERNLLRIFQEFPFSLRFCIFSISNNSHALMCMHFLPGQTTRRNNFLFAKSIARLSCWHLSNISGPHQITKQKRFI